MSDGIQFDFREWQGARQAHLSAYRRYDFPVIVRKVEDDQQPEAPDQ